MKPEDLVNALQDRVHRESGAVRAGRSTKTSAISDGAGSAKTTGFNLLKCVAVNLLVVLFVAALYTVAGVTSMRRECSCPSEVKR